MGEGVEAVKNFEGRITASVSIACIVAASAGMLYGYDLGVSGGVTVMESFLSKFFPTILREMSKTKRTEYCTFNSASLMAFGSSIYISGMVSALIASHVTRIFGRRITMLLGGATFLIGSVIMAVAVNIEMLIIGRLCIGFGIGFTNQATPVYLAEMAPPKWRGSFTTGYQFFIAVGIVMANVTNYGASRIPVWGWRLSLGLAIVPAFIMSLGALLIPETPSSLIQRGHSDKALQTLRRIRGHTANVEAELQYLTRAIELSLFAKSPYRAILEKRYRPQLAISMAVSFFRQMTGIGIVSFYAPVLFKATGSATSSALLGMLLLAVVNLGSILVSTILVDRCGRRLLFFTGGSQMFICQLAMAFVLAKTVGASGNAPIVSAYAWVLLVLLFLFAAAFGWSWGPLSWVVPSEIFAMEIRPAGQSISVTTNFLFAFLVSQTFLKMLCHFKFGAFLFYAAWIFIMTMFAYFFLPETKGIMLDSMNTVWVKHWYWKRFVPEENVETSA